MRGDAPAIEMVFPRSNRLRVTKTNPPKFTKQQVILSYLNAIGVRSSITSEIKQGSSWITVTNAHYDYLKNPYIRYGETEIKEEKGNVLINKKSMESFLYTVDMYIDRFRSAPLPSKQWVAESERPWLPPVIPQSVRDFLVKYGIRVLDFYGNHTDYPHLCDEQKNRVTISDHTWPQITRIIDGFRPYCDNLELNGIEELETYFAPVAKTALTMNKLKAWKDHFRPKTPVLRLPAVTSLPDDYLALIHESGIEELYCDSLRRLPHAIAVFDQEIYLSKIAFSLKKL